MIGSSLPCGISIRSRYAGRKSVFAFQLGLRTSVMFLPGLYEPTMYGPVATCLAPYSETFSRSSGSAYSRGTGAASGSTSAAASVPPVGRRSLNTTVCASGVAMPEIVVPGFAPSSAPTTSPKYAGA